MDSGVELVVVAAGSEEHPMQTAARVMATNKLKTGFIILSVRVKAKRFHHKYQFWL